MRKSRSLRSKANPATEELRSKANPATEELKKPWQSRVRMDRQVTGAIELAYLRGYHAGYLDGKVKKRPKHYVGDS